MKQEINSFYLRTERFRFPLYLFRVLIRNSKKAEKLRFAFSGFLTDINSNFDESSGPWLVAENSTGGLLQRSLTTAFKYSKKKGEGVSWLLVSEPEGVGKVVSEFLYKSFNQKISVFEMETELGLSWNSQEPNFDLCIPFGREFSEKLKTYDVVFSQSLFEHIVDPVQALRNLSLLVKKGGILVVHTHTPAMPIHRYPIDTLRFNEDWFFTVGKYVNLRPLRVDIFENVILGIFQKSADV